MANQNNDQSRRDPTVFKDYSKLSVDESRDQTVIAELAAAAREIAYGRASVLLLGKRKDDEPIRIVTRYQDELWTQNYVGVLWHQGKTFVIRSRFDDEEGHFTHYILADALGLRGLHLPEQNPQLVWKQTIEQVLAFIFVNRIKIAQKQGLYRAYTDYARNDSHPRGRIDISRHIRLNPITNGKIAYSGRERSMDNPVNRVILAAYSLLEKHYRELMTTLVHDNHTVKECIGQLRDNVPAISRQEIAALMRQRDRKINSPLYKEWESVRRIARMILRRMAPDLTKSADREMDGILIDMNDMWELYLEKVLRQTQRENLRLRSQHEYPVLLPPGEEKEGKRTFRPDFYWEQGEKTVLLADAKYKNAWSDIAAGKNGEAWKKVREDVFQVLSYMYVQECSRGVIICPVQGARRQEKPLEYVVSGKEHDARRFYVFGLTIPQGCESSEDFTRQMKNAEEELRSWLKGLLPAGSQETELLV